MTYFLAISISALLLGLAFMQAVYVWYFYRFVTDERPLAARPSRDTLGEKQISHHLPGPNSDPFDPLLDSGTPLVEQADRPPVAVVLCLRGRDPSLVDCLAGIAAQEYPNLQLHLVVDDILDPSLDIVRNFFNQNNVPTIHVISERRDSCSLKCAALVEAVRSAPSEIEIFAFLDSDTVPDQNWIRDLVTPLADPQVGATTGNRWFAPSRPTLGSYVRQSWNAAAIVQMDLYNIAWGGTFAIKRSTLTQCGLLEKWKQAFCEDTMLLDVLRKNQLKLVRVPNLIAENAESTSLTDAYRWIVRQLVTVRLYHPKWPLIRLHGWATAVASVLAPIAIIGFYLTNERTPLLITAAAFLFCQCLNVILLFVIELMNRRIIDQRDGFNQPKHQPVNLPLKILAIGLAQYLHPLSCWMANNTRTISWRGINYEIGKKNAITMLKYVPYREIDSAPISDEIADPQSIS